ncbi:hypothetical protein SAMN05443637_10692 [Pseudonocardia thermophila]|jgi:hypothetical protein|uniref:TadE-like protein n=1 Tax=Pseudonocardia thermophila TaxID=1848 RepID=A0A1M6SDP4_PSETH|nr:hypothetical protein SAMN05443637_10692 [Pseudonocardia thermophila]
MGRSRWPVLVDRPRHTAAARRAPPGDRGAVTVEAALAMAALTVVLAVAVGAVATAGAAVRCADAARELVRLATRGEADRGRAVAAELAPAGASIELEVAGDLATGTVSVHPAALLPIAITGRSVGALEPGVAGVAAEPGAPP